MGCGACLGWNAQLASSDEANCFIKILRLDEGVLRYLEVCLERVIDGLVVDATTMNSALHFGLDQVALFWRDVFGGQRTLVVSSLADRGEYFGGYPALEALGLLELRAEDEGVEA